MVFTWHSMNPFDIGYRGYEMMWSMCCEDKSLASVSDEKRGPLSVENLLGGLYWDINSCNILIMAPAVLEDIWSMI